MANWLTPIGVAAREGVVFGSVIFSASPTSVVPETNEVGEGIIKLDTVLPSIGKKLLRLAARGAGDIGGARRLPDAEDGGGVVFETGAGTSSFVGVDSATIGVEFGIGPNEPVVENRTSI